MFFSLNPTSQAPYFFSKKSSFVLSPRNISKHWTRSKKPALGNQPNQPSSRRYSQLTRFAKSSIESLPPGAKKSDPLTSAPCSLPFLSVSAEISKQGEAKNLGNKQSVPQSNTVQKTTTNQTKPDNLNRVIVITSGKGGVGKTSITANIGMSIARLGYKTVLIDADIGLKNLDLLVGLENRIMYTVMDVFEGRCRLDQALTRDKRWNNLSLLSISKNRQRYNITRKNMDNLVQALVNLDYSYILIDCPAGIDVGFINAISPANEAIIVTTPELPALRDADRVAGLLEANSIYDIKLLVNRVRPDLVSSHNMLSIKDVQQALGIPLLGAVPEDLEIILSTNFGEPLVLRKKLTLAGLALETVARRLVGYQTNFLNLDTPYKNTLQRVAGFLLSHFQSPF